MEPVDHRFASVFDLAILDDADLEGRATHIGRDHVGLTEQFAQYATADYAGRRPALQHADRTIGRLLRRQEPAIALHHHHRAAIACLLQQCLQAAQIVAGDTPRISIDDGRRRPFILARNGCDLAGERAIDLRRDPLDQLADLALVLRIVERPEKRHGKRFNALFSNQETDGRFGRRLIEFL